MIASALPTLNPASLAAYIRAYPSKLRAKDALNTALYRAEVRYQGIASRTAIAPQLSNLFQEQVRLVGALNAAHRKVNEALVEVAKILIARGYLPPGALSSAGVGVVDYFLVAMVILGVVAVLGLAFPFFGQWARDIQIGSAEADAIREEAIANSAQLDRELRVWEQQVAATPPGQPVPPPPSRNPSPVPPKDSPLVNIDGGIVVGIAAIGLILWLGGRKR